MSRVEIEILDENEMISLAERLALSLSPGDVVGLAGDLGAGKTFFATAVARFLGVPDSESVNSPTFTLINEYRGGRFPIYHMDLYRLGDAAELFELGLWEYYDGDGVCLVEWCDRFSELWPKEALVLQIGLGEGQKRTVVARGEGRGSKLADQLAG